MSRQAVRLRAAEEGDLPVLYAYQLDAEANRLAGTRPRSEAAFRAAWERGAAGAGAVTRVIECGGVVVGSVACFGMEDGTDALGYWIGREHWGKGYATRGLALLLEEVKRRPLRADVARHNAASMRVLERCGFRLVGKRMAEETERYVAGEVWEFVLE